MHMYFNFSATRILIVGGNISGQIVSTSYILNIPFHESSKLSNTVRTITYKRLPNFPTANSLGFAVSCDGRSIIGGGLDNKLKYLTNVYELDTEEYQPLPSLNILRKRAGVCSNSEIIKHRIEIILHGGL